MMSWILVIFLLVSDPSGRYHTEMRTMPQTHSSLQECAGRFARMTPSDVQLKPGETLARAYGRCEVQYDV